MTKKQQGFVADYIETGNATLAAKKNYNVKDSVARSVGSENLTKPDIIVAIEEHRITLKEALEEKGITPEKIAEKVGELLDAKKQIFKNNNDTGEIELVGESPDFQAIDKGITHAVKIRGDYSDAPPAPKGSSNTYNFIFSAPVQEQIQSMEENIKKLLVKKPNE